MIPGEQLAKTFSANQWLIHRLTEGLDHNDSLFQPPYQVNRVNWIIGHLVYNRNFAVTLLGGQPVWEGDQLSRYRTGSEPLNGPETALPFDELLRALDLAQVQFEALLAEATRDSLDEIVETPRGERPLWQELDGLGWHETYHTGQLEMLRQMILEARPA